MEAESENRILKDEGFKILFERNQYMNCIKFKP